MKATGRLWGLLTVALISTPTLILSGCAYSQGSISEKGAKFLSSGDIHGPFTLRVTSSSVELDVRDFKSSVTQKIALRDPKGDVLLVNGSPVFEEIPVLPGMYSSPSHKTIWTGISDSVRSVGSFAGTIISGLVGIEAFRATDSLIQTVNP